MDLFAARTTSRASGGSLADLVDRGGTILDRTLDLMVGHDMAEAEDHEDWIQPTGRPGSDQGNLTIVITFSKKLFNIHMLR
jgi:hypothetical protein